MTATITYPDSTGWRDAILDVLDGGSHTLARYVAAGILNPANARPGADRPRYLWDERDLHDAIVTRRLRDLIGSDRSNPGWLVLAADVVGVWRTIGRPHGWLTVRKGGRNERPRIGFYGTPDRIVDLLAYGHAYLLIPTAPEGGSHE